MGRKIMDAKLQRAKEIAKVVFEKSTQKKYWAHTQRVLQYAKSIGSSERADLGILLPAALVHDIGMTIDAGFPSHVEKSRLLGKWVLKDAGYGDGAVASIIKVACSHHPEPGMAVETLEEKVLFDSDNMEIVGVFGALRWIGSLPATREELHASIELFLSIVEKCVAARGSLFFTDTARRIGDSVLDSTVEYFM